MEAEIERVAEREILELDASIAFEGSLETFPARVKKLSTVGAVLTTDQEIKSQQRIRLLLHTHQGSWCPIDGRVVSVVGGHVGVSFLRLGTAAATMLNTLLAGHASPPRLH